MSCANVTKAHSLFVKTKAIKLILILKEDTEEETAIGVVTNSLRTALISPVADWLIVGLFVALRKHLIIETRISPVQWGGPI